MGESPQGFLLHYRMARAAQLLTESRLPISTISTMETFQKIYRPEIYNANSVAAQSYQPSLNYQDFSLTQIVYDREERSRLAIEQGKWTEEHFIKPYQNILEQWAASYTDKTEAA